MQLTGSSVPDVHGSPMNVSAIIDYRVTDAVKASYSVQNLEAYIHNQALEVIRRVCAHFPYRAKANEASLMADGKILGNQMKELV
jgi:regulator of protease activity HflC (stomatin/prohibitin superfamily)